MKYIDNERGSILYIMMILIVVGIVMPSILLSTSSNQLSEQRSENERKTSSLAVSSMEAFLNLSGSQTDQFNYMTNSDLYGAAGVAITLPEGDVVHYRQYYVADSVSGAAALVLANVVASPVFGQNYNAVITVTTGDTMEPLNQKRDDGERNFSIKSLIRPFYSSPTGPTAIPVIYPIPRATETVVQGTSEANAFIVVTRNTVEIGSGTASAGGNYSVTVSVLVAADVIQATATAPGKSISTEAQATVLAANATPPPGYIVIVDPVTGDTSYQSFQDEITLVGEELIVTSSVGTYTTSDAIDLSADEGITIEPGVSLTTTSNGANSGFSLASSGGDIVLSGASISSDGNSTFSEVTIVAAGDVYLEGTIIESIRDISITAGGNIYANNAVITAEQANATITFKLLDTSKFIFVNNMDLNKNAFGYNSSNTTAGVKICGTLAGADTINSINSHNNCP